MAPAYKLIYFDLIGITEPIRFLFKYGNIDFEDVRIKREDWPKLKDATPLGQLPILEHNGRRINQSVAICRYVAKLVNLAGNDDWENLEIDAVMDTIRDIKGKGSGLRHIQDEAKGNALKETMRDETIPYYLSRLDALIEKNKGYLALGRLTWVDFQLVCVVPTINRFFESDVCSKYQNVMALVDKVNELPAIKKWIAERPETEY